MYTDFAEIYDELMSAVRYGDWAAFYADLLRSLGIVNGSRVCECACGTGSLTVPLARMGYRMTGVDASQEMLFLAAQKARQAMQAIPFVRQDMRSLRLHRPVDAVLATCDGVNYLLRDADASAFFKSAWQALRPGGALIFDVSSPWKLRNELGNRLLCEDAGRITYLWQNTLHENTALVDLRLTFFVRQEDGLYRRIDEDQRQRIWEADTLNHLLLRAGFTDILFFGGASMTPPQPQEERWHIIARKPETEGEV